MLALFSFSVAQASTWNTMDLLNNLKRQGKVAEVQMLPVQQVNQKTLASFQITLKQGQEQHVFRLLGKTAKQKKVLQGFELQLENFMVVKKSQVFSSQAGYLQALMLGLSQVCFGLQDRDHAALQGFFKAGLLRYNQNPQNLNVSKVFPQVKAGLSINAQTLRFTVENLKISSKDDCILPE
ncbi:hypothetical protein GCM10008938_29400 [Deinococcus roseus]|uniref:DUF1439 domain-containing protein n=2 Tax=Deinococcus roseus TaxID=392414 RepID=A0ABQ2D1G5_9DEIO|nr:hypothetical protein GCM10008938_29400 [Deinococcus roseus]